MLNPNSVIGKLSTRLTGKKKKTFYTTEEKIAHIKNEYGLVHGKGKRKKKYNKRGRK